MKSYKTNKKRNFHESLTFLFSVSIDLLQNE